MFKVFIIMPTCTSLRAEVLSGIVTVCVDVNNTSLVTKEHAWITLSSIRRGKEAFLWVGEIIEGITS